MKARHSFRPHILMGSNLIHFTKVVFALKSIRPKTAIPRLFVSWLILLLFTPFRILESILYFFSKKEAVKEPVFIVGHFRSGTTFIHDALNELEEVVAPRMIDCLYPYMNKYFKFMLVPILKKALPEERLMDKMKVKWDSPQEEEFALSLMTTDTSVSFLFAPNNHAKRLNKSILLKGEKVKRNWLKAHLKFAQKIQSMNPGKTLVFKSPSNTARINQLMEIYPDAKFIHIVRNPIDVIPSTLNLYKKILPEFSLQDATKVDLNEYVFQFYEQVMKQYEESAKGLTDSQLFELKYEDFVAQPINELKKGFTQLQIDASVESLKPFFEKRKNFKRNKFQLEKELESTIFQRCKHVFDAYNYTSSNK